MIDYGLWRIFNVQYNFLLFELGCECIERRSKHVVTSSIQTGAVRVVELVSGVSKFLQVPGSVEKCPLKWWDQDILYNPSCMDMLWFPWLSLKSAKLVLSTLPLVRLVEKYNSECGSGADQRE